MGHPPAVLTFEPRLCHNLLECIRVTYVKSLRDYVAKVLRKRITLAIRIVLYLLLRHF